MRPLVLSLLFILFITGSAQALTELRSIRTRSAVSMEYLLMTAGKNPLHDVLVLFPGGNGVGPFRVTEEGAVFGWSFLIRSADDLVRSGLSVVAVNPPSDHLNGMSSGFRESDDHAEDIAILLAELEKSGFERIFLVGNSRGTISVASLATKLKSPRIKGVILTSTLEYDNFLQWIPLERLNQPVLMIHHRNDACRVSSFEQAEKTRARLAEHTTVDFVELDGGAAPRSADCDNLSAHGFFGLEDRVVPIIAEWVRGRKIPARISDVEFSPPTPGQTLENYQ